MNHYEQCLFLTVLLKNGPVIIIIHSVFDLRDHNNFKLVPEILLCVMIGCDKIYSPVSVAIDGDCFSFFVFKKEKNDAFHSIHGGEHSDAIGMC